MELDTSRWSGEGSFTQLLIPALQQLSDVSAVRVEDAPASRADSGYNFIANEVFVTCGVATAHERHRWLGLVPYTRKWPVLLMNLGELASRLSGVPGIGEPNYADEGMIQYLRTERVVAPYQTKGVKVIELVRIYLTGVPSP